MKKISSVHFTSSIILFLEKFIPDKFLKLLISFGIEGYIKRYANLKVINGEKLNHIKAPVIFICNHLSNADGLILNKVLKKNKVTFIMGVKLTQDPFTNLGTKVVRNIQITPSSPDRNAISNLVNHVKSGNNILIFPEGTRSRSGSMIKAKKGIYLISKLCNVPIVPLGIYGSEKFMPVNKSGNMDKEIFCNAEVCVNIGEEIYIPNKLDGESKQDYEERCVEYLMTSIAKLLPCEYRGEYGKNEEKC